MKILFETLFSVEINHGFFLPDGGGSNLFSVIPTPSCQSAMQAQGMVFRQTPAGYSVFYEYEEVKEGGITRHRPVRPFPKTLLLSFMINPLMKYFLNRTDLPVNTSTSSIYRFTNLNHNQSGKVLYLNNPTGAASASCHDQIGLRPPVFTETAKSSNPFVRFEVKSELSGTTVFSKQEAVLREKADDSEGISSSRIDLSREEAGIFSLTTDKETISFYSGETVCRKSPFGVVDIYIHEKVPAPLKLVDEQDRAVPRRYTLSFAPRKVWWRYRVVARNRSGMSASDIAVTSLDPLVSFGVPVNGPEMSGEKTFFVTSTSKVGFHYKTKTGLSLVWSGSQPFSLDNLPNPGAGRLIPHESIENAYYAESYIYL